jgi:hypothetical protein
VGSTGAKAAAVGSTAAGAAGDSVTAEGAHEARITVNRLNRGRKRGLLIVTSFGIGFETRYIKKTLPEY